VVHGHVEAREDRVETKLKTVHESELRWGCGEAAVPRIHGHFQLLRALKKARGVLPLEPERGRKEGLEALTNVALGGLFVAPPVGSQHYGDGSTKTRLVPYEGVSAHLNRRASQMFADGL